MKAVIARYLNKTVYVAIPALFDDGTCRPFTLLGAELHGLWLQSDELSRRLLPADKPELAVTPTAVCVPFAQIAGVLVGAGAAQSQQPQPDNAPSEGAARGRSRVRSTATDGGGAAPQR